MDEAGTDRVEAMERILEKLRIAWNMHPSWRFGQLVVNCMQSPGQLFLRSDDQLEQGLDKVISRGHAPG